MSASENQVTSDSHSHHEKPHYDDINAPVIFVLAVISAIVTFAIVATVQGAFYQVSNQKFYDPAFKTMGSEFVAEEKSVLTKGSEERGITKIEDAMKAVVSDAGGSWKRAHSHSHDGGVTSHSHDDEETPAAKHDKKDTHGKKH